MREWAILAGKGRLLLSGSVVLASLKATVYCHFPKITTSCPKVPLVQPKIGFTLLHGHFSKFAISFKMVPKSLSNIFIKCRPYGYAKVKIILAEYLSNALISK